MVQIVLADLSDGEGVTGRIGGGVVVTGRRPWSCHKIVVYIFNKLLGYGSSCYNL